MEQVYHTAKQLCLFTEDMSIPDDLLLTHPLPEEERKICWSCLPHPQIKHLSEFKVDRQKRDGHSSKCKECYKRERATRSEEEKEQDRQIRKASEDKRREEIRAHDRARKNTAEVRAQRRARHAQIPIEERTRKQRALDAARQIPVIITEKLCPTCEPPQVKNIDEFPLNRKRRDKHGTYCKECVHKQHKSEEMKTRKRERTREKMQNPEYRQAVRQSINEWRRNNPLGQRELTLRRNARKRTASVGRVSFKHILERDGMFCHICQQTIVPEEPFEFDHVIPLSRGGAHSEENIKVAHAKCNRSKAGKLIEELFPHHKGETP